MFRFIAKLKFKKLQRKITNFGEITPDNWNEYKALFIESLRMACKADTNCSDDILYWNMLAIFRRYQDTYATNMPVEYYTDLFVTLRKLSREHHPEIWDMVEKMRDK